jgi:hypothetical protein
MNLICQVVTVVILCIVGSEYHARSGATLMYRVLIASNVTIDDE